MLIHPKYPEAFSGGAKYVFHFKFMFYTRDAAFLYLALLSYHYPIFCKDGRKSDHCLKCCVNTIPRTRPQIKFKFFLYETKLLKNSEGCRVKTDVIRE